MADGIGVARYTVMDVETQGSLEYSSIYNRGTLYIDESNDGGTEITTGSVTGDGAYIFGNADGKMTLDFSLNCQLWAGQNTVMYGGTGAQRSIINVASVGQSTSTMTANGYMEGYTTLVGNSVFEVPKDYSITRIDGLKLVGTHAFVANSGSLDYSSALRNVSQIDQLILMDGARISTSADLKVSRNLYIGVDCRVTAGGDMLPTLGFGMYGSATGASFGQIKAKSFELHPGRTGYIQGHNVANKGRLVTESGFINNGRLGVSMDFDFDTTVTGRSGMISLLGSDYVISVRFDKSVDASQKVQLQNNVRMVLADPTSFHASIEVLGSGDTIDLKGFGIGSTISFTAGKYPNVGVLAVRNADGTKEADLNVGFAYGETPGFAIKNGGNGVSHISLFAESASTASAHGELAHALFEAATTGGSISSSTCQTDIHATNFFVATTVERLNR